MADPKEDKKDTKRYGKEETEEDTDTLYSKEDWDKANAVLATKK